MSQLYPDLTNAFPDSIDPNRSFSDVTSSNRALVEQYYTYKSSGNDSAATDLLNNNPNLKNTIVTAEMIQLIYDMNISQQRFYLNDVQQYLVNLVKPKGNWNETTTYTKYDVVQYVVNGAIQSYMGAVVNIPIGTLPTNTSYYVPITLRGEQGASGTGLSVRGVWNSLDTYYVNDCVSLNNAMWYAIVENTNNAPNDLSTYWKKFADLPSPIRVSTTQPASQNVGDEWHQISDTDNSLAIKVKQADGSYVAKNVVSNASFITTSDGSNVQAKLENMVQGATFGGEEVPKNNGMLDFPMPTAAQMRVVALDAPVITDVHSISEGGFYRSYNGSNQPVSGTSFVYFAIREGWKIVVVAYKLYGEVDMWVCRRDSSDGVAFTWTNWTRINTNNVIIIPNTDSVPTGLAEGTVVLRYTP